MQGSLGRVVRLRRAVIRFVEGYVGTVMGRDEWMVLCQ